MTELFGIPIERVMIGVLVLLGISLASLAFIAWRRPLLLRMGVRNITRRPTQTVLIVVGLMLSTLIMSAAFATGDTVGYSITSRVYSDLQETDITLSFDPDRAQPGQPQTLRDTDLTTFRAAFASNPDIDAVTGGVEVETPAINRQQRLSEPKTRMVGLDPATADAFKTVRDHDGRTLPIRNLGSGEAYITRSLARAIDAAPGSTVTVFFENQPHDFRVAQIMEDISGATLGPAGAPSSSALVVPLDVARGIANRGDELDSVAVSVRGGVRDTAERAKGIETQIEDYLRDAPIPAQIGLTKNQLVTLANLVGSVFVTFFVLFGLFSIAAGVLLIFLIFVMLAAERRTEMGISRAIGMSRQHLTEAFIAEGMTYNIGSAAIGAALGVGVSYLLILALRQIFSGQLGLNMAFHVNPTGLVIAYGLGVVITFATVAYSSWRAANLNIVRAIRDLPEPNPLRNGRASFRGLTTASLGALWTLAWLGLASLWVAAGIGLFIASLGFYGVGVILGIPLGAWFVLAIQSASRPFEHTRGWRRAAYLLWWVVFLPISFVTWFLVRTGRWAKRYRNAGGWAVWMLLVGFLFTYLGGWVWGQAFAYTAGHTLAILAIAMLAVYFGAPPRQAFTLAGLVLVWFWLLPLPFSLLFEAGKGWSDPLRGVVDALGLPSPKRISGNVEMFFVSGISITASATLVVIFNAPWFLAIAGLLGRALGGAMPAVRTAIAYPLAARFRTGMTLAMFGLVVFSLVVMASLNYNFTQLFLGKAATAGFDVMVQTNENNRIDDLRADLRGTDPSALEGVTAVGKLVSSRAEAVEPEKSAKYLRLGVRGADDEFLRTVPLTMRLRAAGYDADRAVLEALRSDPTTAVIDASYLRQPGGQFGGGPQRFSLSVAEIDLRDHAWDPIPITVRDAETGVSRDLRIIGILDPQQSSVIVDLSTLVTAEANVTSTFGGGRERTFLLTTTEGDRNAERVAKQIESALLERGVEADSLHLLIEEAAAQSTSFQMLFEGFMGLGLVVGIAALGVIAFRTVVERRQQIGMLRAIGYTRRLVALSFFLESSFIALTGIAMGFFLGVALSYNLMTSPDFTGGQEINFQVPWVRLTVIGFIAYGASALMTLLPARAASRVPVAEALRYE